ncbi:MAG: MFS transporter [Methylobacteriaceae bacterium]|nr:MFS transporter [Methylobacteriaceae bacterium]
MKLRSLAGFAALNIAFALSNALRTLPAIVAHGIEADLKVSAEQIGYFAGIFHLAFGLMQLPFGVALDRFNIRAVVAIPLLLAALGAGVCAVATRFDVLLAAQFLIGVGCAPALMATFLFIQRHYSPQRFASLSGIVFTIGYTGMIVTGTPLAFLVERSSWRAGFIALGAASALCALALWLLIGLEELHHKRANETLSEAIRGVLRVMRFRQTAGLVAIGLVTYPTVITLRGLWIAPLFARRHDLDLVAIGNVILAMSLAMIIAPTLYGFIDPGMRARPRLIVAATFASAVCPAALAFGGSTSFDVAWAVAFGAVCSSQGLLYSQVRDTYPDQLSGRALSTLNMAAFLGVAIMQGCAGLIAAWAQAHDRDPIAAVCAFLTAALVAGGAAYASLPKADARKD